MLVALLTSQIRPRTVGLWKCRAHTACTMHRVEPGRSAGRGREDGICEICANLHMWSSVPQPIFPDAVCRWAGLLICCSRLLAVPRVASPASPGLYITFY